MISHFLAATSSWRRAAEHPLALGLLLLAPIVFLLPPLPIDETRYLAVAWEMRLHGEFLVPHLNGALYSQKPPLLFWLINAGWLLTGVHAWTARVVTLACSLLSLFLLQRLTLRLTGSEMAARLSLWFLLGAIYFAAFANAIMFDVPLTTCVLLAVHGLCDIADGHGWRGVPVTGVAIGLGVLVKGPVMLLDIAFVALAAPWWSASTLHDRRARYFGAVGLAILLGAAIGLTWAIPAALHAGPKYAHAIFLHQTLDRIEGIKGASTHGRPWWWYALVFPLMVLPWPLVVRGTWSKFRELVDNRAIRLAIAWLAPTFVAFSLVGGKQPHYLLPMIPALALALAVAIDRSALRVQSGLFALVLIVLGLVAAVAPHFASTHTALTMLGQTSPVWGVVIAALGIGLFFVARHDAQPAWAALAMLAVVLVVKLAIEQGQGARYDVSGVAAEVRAAQDRGQPILHLGRHHGVYEFAGRLLQPLPVIEDAKQFPAWAQDHPDGLVMSFDRRYRFRANPVYTQPFRGGEVSIWTVHDALVSGIDPAIAHLRAASDDDDED